MSSVEDVKNRILEWCKDEGFNPQTVYDPSARFNIAIQVSGLEFSIIQRASPDSFFIATRMILQQQQYRRLESLEPDARQEFLLDLQLTLASNQNILEFNIGPNPPNQIREIFISSKPIAYDGFSKHILLSRVYDVFKAFFVLQLKIAQAIGGPSPSSPRFQMYT